MRKFHIGRREGQALLCAGLLAALVAMLADGVDAAPGRIAAGRSPMNGSGFASARGADHAARLRSSRLGRSGRPVSAQFAAITNCHASLSTRPFLVRWSVHGTTFTFRKTRVLGSRCLSNSSGASVIRGFGRGRMSFAGARRGASRHLRHRKRARFRWRFSDPSTSDSGGSDRVRIRIASRSGPILRIRVSPPAPLSGTPGGVWAFGALPWPAPRGAR